MTYLGAPRLHFSGLYQADMSTVNNDPSHFDVANFKRSWNQRGEGATKGWWNPQGTGAWRFRDCAVRSVCYADGTTCDDPRADPLVGAPLNGATDRVSGKLVDLDPEQQMVSQIWGFQIVVGLAGARDRFRGDFEPAPFADIWVRFPGGQPDSWFSATYQSVLTSLEWPAAPASRWLDELGRPEMLSVKFTVDGFDDDWESPTFTFGRVTGAIGPYVDGEPHHFVAGRRLRPPTRSPMNFALARLDGDVLYVDFANSVPTEMGGGALRDVGPAELALLPDGAEPVTLGYLDYLRTGWYENLAGIQTFRLTPEQAATAATTRLGVILRRDGTTRVLLEEDAHGSWLQADTYVFRMDPGAPQTTTLYARAFGAPATGVEVDLVVDNSAMEGQVQQGLVPGPPVGVPEGVVTFPASVATGPDGTATVELVTTDPGNPRGYIDGQVYGVRYGWRGVDLSRYQPESTNVLSVLAWDAYEAPATPTWRDDVAPIFTQYADLYPVMRRVLDLDDYQSCLDNLLSLQYVFALPPSDPNYMPVVRDLSTAKRTMIQEWLKDPHYMRVDTVDDLRSALQTAIELEHSTIPVYLTSLFSIKDGHNREIASLIQGVVVEEMLHMALACNLLNAIGGHPAIDDPAFVPAYPGPLPGGLRPDLKVSLRKLSIEHVRDVFMGIEEPSETIDPKEHHKLTIGWFYAQIEKGFERLSQQGRLFVPNSPQLTSWRGPGKIVVVTDLASAKQAIREIVVEGEGTSATHPGDSYHELAHYYKFAEIVHGRRLVVSHDGYSYTGAPIPFDPAGVYPMVDDPSTAALTEGSRVRAMSERFDEQYAQLLRALHETFNTDPDALLGNAIEMMFSLEVAAKGLLQMPVAAGSPLRAGPSWQHPARAIEEVQEPAESTYVRVKPPTHKGQPATRLRGGG